MTDRQTSRSNNKNTLLLNYSGAYIRYSSTNIELSRSFHVRERVINVHVFYIRHPFSLIPACIDNDTFTKCTFIPQG